MRRVIVVTVATLILWATIRTLIPPDTLRAANVALSAAAAAGIAIRVNSIWRYLSFGRRLTFGGAVAMFVVTAYGTAEAYVQSVKPGERVPLISTTCLIVLAGLWMSRHDDPSNSTAHLD